MKTLIAFTLAMILYSINPTIFPTWGWALYWVIFMFDVLLGMIVGFIKAAND